MVTKAELRTRLQEKKAQEKQTTSVKPMRILETIVCVFATIGIGKYFIEAGIIHLNLGMKIAIGFLAIIIFAGVFHKYIIKGR